MCKQGYLAVAGFLLLLESSVFSQSKSQDDTAGLREQCRKAALADYVSNYDRREIAQGYIVTLTAKQSSLIDNIKSQQKSLDEINVKFKDKDFNLAYSRERDRFTSAIKTLESQKLETMELLDKAKSTTMEQQSKVKNLETKLSKIFKIVKATHKKDGYPIEMEYKSSCPKFRYICPLTKPEARDLLILSKDNLDFYESCVRYANYSGVEVE